MILENCTFECNVGKHTTDDILVIQKPLIEIVISHSSKSIIFKDCHFKNNYNDHYFILITIQGTDICEKRHCVGPLANITFVIC